MPRIHTTKTGVTILAALSLLLTWAQPSSGSPPLIGRPHLLKNTFKGVASSDPGALTPIPVGGGRTSLCYEATDGPNHGQWTVLWRSDGTPAGTEKVMRVSAYVQRQMVEMGGSVYLFARPLPVHREPFLLMKTDCTKAGTSIVAPLTDQPAYGLTTVGNAMYFVSTKIGGGRQRSGALAQRRDRDWNRPSEEHHAWRRKL